MRWLALNDFHLGHDHVPPEVAHENIRSIVYPILKNGIDLLTIGGDFYDTALYLDQHASVCAMDILDELCDMAKKHDFAIRVIRGTYTHDRDQLIQMVPKATKLNLDFKYYTDISVDMCRGYSFLYLPDNLPYSTEVIMERVYKLLVEYDNKIDCVIGHGYFDHALPLGLQIGQHLKGYQASDFESFVNQIVVMGHVHQSSHHGKIWYTGSFDRFYHGEEEPKGCLLIELGKDQPKVKFIENTFAMPHISIKLNGNTVEECYSTVLEEINRKFPTPIHGYLRIVGDDMRKTICAMLREKYQGQLVITDLDINKRNKSMTKTRLDIGLKEYSSDPPTMMNLSALVYEYLSNRIPDFPLTEEEITTGINNLNSRGD